MLSSVLGSMKSVKALDLSSLTVPYITSLRQQELDAAKRVRWMMVAYNASGKMVNYLDGLAFSLPNIRIITANALGLFAPVVTLVLYALLGDSLHSKLNAETAFTTVAILAMVTHPANMLMTIIPRVVASFASFDRIQSYLLENKHRDCRLEIPGALNRQGRPGNFHSAIKLDQVDVDFPKESLPILQSVNMELKPASLVIFSGPVGSGKSVLAKTILGEVRPTRGTVSVRSRQIGFCDQNAWLPSGTFKEVVSAFSANVDHGRYQAAVRACCLDYDLERLPDGDMTVIGNRGMNLSGGQRQRLVSVVAFVSGGVIKWWPSECSRA